MNKAEEYRNLYRASFSGDSAEWLDWMMGRVYDDRELMLLDNERLQAVSALLLRRYQWRFFDTLLDCGYVFGACTRPGYRSQGYMSHLLTDSLRLAADRGDALCTLIPANKYLYDYYARFGFSPAVMVEQQRFTARHTFDMPAGYTAVPAVYDDFNRLESAGVNTVIHSRREFENILDDLHLDGGEAVAVSRDGEVRAMAFAVPRTNHVHVKALYAADEADLDAVLSLVRGRYGEQMIVADCFVEGVSGGRKPVAKGMVRILDCYQMLSAMAAADRSLCVRVKVHDDILRGNNDIFMLSDGICRRVHEPVFRREVDLDVDISTLAAILGSSPAIGSVMGLRTSHIRMPLMLD